MVEGSQLAIGLSGHGSLLGDCCVVQCGECADRETELNFWQLADRSLLAMDDLIWAKSVRTWSIIS